MSIISYAAFRANVLAGDLQAMATLLSGQTIKTTDPVEATAYQEAGDRLYQPNVEILTKLTRSKERIAGVEWHVFEARVDPIAVGYMAQLAAEGAAAAQNP